MVETAFHFSHRVGVADVNYGGHVSNSAVLNIFQDARIAYLAALGPFSEIDLGGCGLIMPEAHVYYRREMFLADQLVIRVRTVELKRSSFTLDYRILRDGTLTAEGQTPLVCFDYAKHKPCRMPQLFKSALISFEGL
ncbi:MAG: acyl-CoA thioesterase [Desulfuromonadales bacterium]|nr:acyl-CoA thioesterase [Desulfuromonadales bacterium]MBN2791284.1 acyl-CoA thioesterase [Desulfuromonadales bacterium]